LPVATRSDANLEKLRAEFADELAKLRAEFDAERGTSRLKVVG
jgi:hypothetical protein